MPGVFVIIFVYNEMGRKKLKCFGKQSSDLMPALRIGWHEMAVSSYILNSVWQCAYFACLKVCLLYQGKQTKLRLPGRLLEFLCLLILNLDVVCSP